jgi:hypothetical protein
MRHNVGITSCRENEVKMSAAEILGYVQSLLGDWGVSGLLQAAIIMIVAFLFLASVKNIFSR